MRHFFIMFLLQKPIGFIFVPVFIRKFISGTILHESIVYEQSDEIIRCCLNCRKKIFSDTNYREEPNDFFNDLKKTLIRYFYVYDRYDTE